MKKNVHLRSILYRPARSILLLLLCGGLSFLFLFQVVQYVILENAATDAAEYYKAIGEIISDEPYAIGTENALALLEENPYVDYTQVSISTSGIMDGIYNVNTGRRIGSYGLNPMYLQGTLLGIQYVGPENVDRSARPHLILQMDVTEVLAGQPEIAQKGTDFYTLYMVDVDALERFRDELEVGTSYLFSAEVAYESGRWKLEILPLDSEGLYLFPVESGMVDLSDPALSGVLDGLAITRENQYAANVVLTKDMSTIPYAEEKFYLNEGRLLTREDDLNASPVCVIRQELADMRGLSVGDEITLTLRDLETTVYGYILPQYLSSPWSEAATETKAFTIVGTYSNLDAAEDISDFYSTIYIPYSCCPASWDNAYQYYLMSISFVLHSPDDIEAFQTSCSNALADLGAQARFIETGWENFSASVKPMQTAALFNAALFGGILLLGLVLVVFLYALLHRRELALQRALGVPARRAAMEALLGLGVLGLLGTSCGTAAAYQIGLERARSVLETLEGNIGAVRFDPLILGLLAGAVWLVLVLLGALVLARASSRPVLSQLQGGRPAAKGSAAHTLPSSGAIPMEDVKSSVPSDAPAAPLTVHGRSAGWAVSLRYLLRRNLRAPGTLLLTFAVTAALLVGVSAIQWKMARDQERIDYLYSTVEVHGRVEKKRAGMTTTNPGFIPASLVDQLRDTGYLSDILLEAEDYVNLSPNQAPEETAKGVLLRAVQDLSRMDEIKSGTLSIEFLPGWSIETFMDESVNVPGDAAMGILVSADQASLLDVGCGDSIRISLEHSSRSTASICGIFTGDIGCDVLMNLNQLFVLGSSSGSDYIPSYSKMVFTLDPAYNRLTEDIRELAEGAIAGYMEAGDKFTIEPIFVLLDSELTQAVAPLEKNQLLMKLLYPVTQGVTLLVAAALAAMIVLQWKRDTALLRVLGNPRSRVCAMLCAGPVCSVLMGMAAGAALAWGLMGGQVTAKDLALCAALQMIGGLAGAGASAVWTTAGNPLELLQVKE